MKMSNHVLTVQKKNVIKPGESLNDVACLNNNLKPFSTKILQFPMFSHHKIHSNYVDHVQFIGDLIASKSTESLIKIWKADFDHCNKPIVTLGELYYTAGDLWCFRFDTDKKNHQYLSVGNKFGKIYVFNLNSYFQSLTQCNILFESKKND